jgi:hypothetical protein
MNSRRIFLALSLVVSVGSLTPSLAADKEACPVTKVDHPFVPPSSYKYPTVGSGEFLYGTPALWTLIYPHWRVHQGGGKLAYFRQGYDWLVEKQPHLTVVARRLDGDGPPVSNRGGADNASIPGEGMEGMFMTTGVDIPASGCWEITAQYAPGPNNIQTLAYIVWVEP